MEEQIKKLLNDKIDEQTVEFLSPSNLEKAKEEIKNVKKIEDEKFIKKEINEIKLMGKAFVEKFHDHNKKQFQKKIVRSFLNSDKNNNCDMHHIGLDFRVQSHLNDTRDYYIRCDYRDIFGSTNLYKKINYLFENFTQEHQISIRLKLSHVTFYNWNINDMLTFFGYDKQTTINETVEFLKNIGWLAIAFPKKYSCEMCIINPNPKSDIKITVRYDENDNNNDTKDKWIDKTDELLTNKKKEFDSYGLVLNYELPKTILFWTSGTINITISKK